MSRKVKKGRVAPSLGGLNGNTISIFISYASEDQGLASDIDRLIKRTFPLAPLKTFLDIENINPGDNYAEIIDAELDKADVLLLLLTGRRKLSHSYTGYEVGYFSNSIKGRPSGNGGQQRILIPFCIGAVNPDMLHFIQGVSIEPSALAFFDVEKASEIDSSISAYKLLEAIYEKVAKILELEDSSPDSDYEGKLTSASDELCEIIGRYSKNLVSSLVYPERKIVISMDRSPVIRKDGADLANAKVELYGDFSAIFAISPSGSSGRAFSWDEFKSSLPDELRSKVATGIEYLASATLNKNGDNYHIVTTENREKSFRLFVSKIVTYVSQRTEIDIYAVGMISRDYGDALTTRLLKLASVGLRFRFLVIEDQSKFTPEKLGFPSVTIEELKRSVLEMQSEMGLIAREADQANINDPGLLIQIYGKGENKKVSLMMHTWDAVKKRLNAASDEILEVQEGSDFEAKRIEFIDALTSFRDSVNEMNREFTSRVLNLLKKEVEMRLK